MRISTSTPVYSPGAKRAGDATCVVDRVVVAERSVESSPCSASGFQSVWITTVGAVGRRGRREPPSAPAVRRPSGGRLVGRPRRPGGGLGGRRHRAGGVASLVVVAPVGIGRTRRRVAGRPAGRRDRVMCPPGGWVVRQGSRRCWVCGRRCRAVIGGRVVPLARSTSRGEPSEEQKTTTPRSDDRITPPKVSP